MNALKEVMLNNTWMFNEFLSISSKGNFNQKKTKPNQPRVVPQFSFPAQNFTSHLYYGQIYLQFTAQMKAHNSQIVIEEITGHFIKYLVLAAALK